MKRMLAGLICMCEQRVLAGITEHIATFATPVPRSRPSQPPRHPHTLCHTTPTPPQVMDIKDIQDPSVQALVRQAEECWGLNSHMGWQILTQPIVSVRRCDRVCMREGELSA